MPILRRLTALAGALAAIACGDRGGREPSASDLAKLSPEIFSHTDAAYVRDGRCGDGEGVLISAESLGPVRLGRSVKALRARCAVASVKVPASFPIEGPALGVSFGGGLIVFTVAGRDSAIQTAGTTSPVFRTPTGIGVGSSGRGFSSAGGPLCFRRDSTQVIEILISRRPMKC